MPAKRPLSCFILQLSLEPLHVQWKFFRRERHRGCFSSLTLTKSSCHEWYVFLGLFWTSSYHYLFMCLFDIWGPVGVWGWVSSFRGFIPGCPDPVFQLEIKKKKKKVSLVHRAGSDIWCPACARMPLPHSVVGFWHFYLILHTHTWMHATIACHAFLHTLTQRRRKVGASCE